jgi:RNA polymerase sigma factor (sigma-70 family)
MAHIESSSALRDLHVLFHVGTVGHLTDGQLLERFVAADVEVAEHSFGVLVTRHGPMVLGVCRRVLKDPHDAADAFQATFLVLVRKARTLRFEGSLSRWLYGVSRRVAMQARKDAARRASRQVSAVESLEAPVHDPERAELLAALDDEIVRLPAKYQTAVVLCDLQELTHAAAARHVGCPVGTIESRLTRGRQRLRTRLTRRGFTSWASVPGPRLRRRMALGSVPQNLANATVHAAILTTLEGWIDSWYTVPIRMMVGNPGGLLKASTVVRVRLLRSQPEGKVPDKS